MKKHGVIGGLRSSSLKDLEKSLKLKQKLELEQIPTPIAEIIEDLGEFDVVIVKPDIELNIEPEDESEIIVEPKVETKSEEKDSEIDSALLGLSVKVEKEVQKIDPEKKTKKTKKVRKPRKKSSLKLPN
jgi:hypothetical protein